jgi:hypothetical protein
MNPQAWAIAHQNYLEAPYQDAIEAQEREEAAVNEFWDEEAASFAADTWDCILDAPAIEELLVRAAALAHCCPSPDSVRGLGETLLEMVRAYCVEHRQEIETRCIARAKDYADEVNDTGDYA